MAGEGTGRNEFSVVQFLKDDSYEYVARWVDYKEAVTTFLSYIRRPAARIGVIQRVIITDGGDCTNLEWKYGEGVTYPPELVGKNLS